MFDNEMKTKIHRALLLMVNSKAYEVDYERKLVRFWYNLGERVLPKELSLGYIRAATVSEIVETLLRHQHTQLRKVTK